MIKAKGSSKRRVHEKKNRRNYLYKNGLLSTTSCSSEGFNNNTNTS